MHYHSGLVDRWTRMVLTHEKKDRYLYPLLWAHAQLTTAKNTTNKKGV